MFTGLSTNSKKSVKLSPLEHSVYFNFYGKEVFRSKEVYKIISNKKTATKILFRLKNKGFVKQIKRGLFAIVPAQMIGKKFSVDKILLASQLTEPYFISHHTALEVHGVAQSYFNFAYISTNKILKPFDFQDVSYKFITTKYMFGIEQVSRGDLKVSASDRERTILDCIRNISYTGGIEELAKSISAFPDLDYKKMLKYLNLFGEKSLFHRTGFIFGSLKDELNFPDDFLDKIRKKLSARTYYLLPNKKGIYIKEWNIIAPENIKEMMKIA
jgi:predicted transcriptional regulator of viral defense system